MGTSSDDLDIVIRGIPYEELFSILSKYGKPVDTSHVDENGKKDFGSTKFVSTSKLFNEFLKNNDIAKDIDIMLPRKDSKDIGVKGHKGIKSEVNPMFTIQDDLERRDITINAIAMDINGNLIVNGTGIEDIKNGIIKAVSKESFIEDPLRMLRAVRFAARYDYKWDPTTIDLIKNNAPLLSDKKELPKDRFLKEFTKMIGKTDLGRAVKTLVELGMYKHIFGITPKNIDYKKFDRAKSIGEMAYIMFENEPLNTIESLVFNNITNNNSILNYIKSLVEYAKVCGKNFNGISVQQNIPSNIVISQLARLYKISSDAMTNSNYIHDLDKIIIKKLNSGELPKNENDLKFKGEDFKNFIIDIVKEKKGEFIPKLDGVKMGKAKKLVLDSVYSGKINNEAESIKNFLIKTTDEWMR